MASTGKKKQTGYHPFHPERGRAVEKREEKKDKELTRLPPRESRKHSKNQSKGKKFDVLSIS